VGVSEGSRATQTGTKGIYRFCFFTLGFLGFRGSRVLGVRGINVMPCLVRVRELVYAYI
jgi:hypothetical protein